MMTEQIQKQKRIRKKQEIPQEFLEDCKTFAIDFEKLQPKVDRVYQKWIGKGYTSKTIGKWLRKELREAGYHPNTAAKVIPPEARAATGPKKFTKNVNSVTTQQQQEEEDEVEWILNDPAQYDPDDLHHYDKPSLIKIIEWQRKQLEEKRSTKSKFVDQKRKEDFMSDMFSGAK